MRCGCLDLDGPLGGRLPSALFRLKGDGSLSDAAFESGTPSLVLGRHEENVDARLADLDRLRRHDRVWVLAAHIFDGEGREYRDQAMPRRLDRLGRRLDAYVGRGGVAFLYDFRS
jgi:hypothetical protein